MKTIDKLEIILQKMKEQNNRLERIYGKHLKLIVCTGKRSEKVKFKHEDWNAMFVIYLDSILNCKQICRNVLI